MINLEATRRTPTKFCYLCDLYMYIYPLRKSHQGVVGLQHKYYRIPISHFGKAVQKIIFVSNHKIVVFNERMNLDSMFIQLLKGRGTPQMAFCKPILFHYCYCKLLDISNTKPWASFVKFPHIEIIVSYIICDILNLHILNVLSANQPLLLVLIN